jgi:hypothetical protein
LVSLKLNPKLPLKTAALLKRNFMKKLLFLSLAILAYTLTHAAAEPRPHKRQTAQDISIDRVQAVFLHQQLQKPEFLAWHFRNGRENPKGFLTQWKEPVSGCIRLGNFALIQKSGTIFEPTHEPQMFQEVEPDAQNTRLVPVGNGKTIKENKRFLWKGFPLKPAPKKSLLAQD